MADFSVPDTHHGRSTSNAFKIEANGNMEVPHSSRAEQVAHAVRLFKAASEGTLDTLECPSCHKHSGSVWFTHPGDGVYRTWFVCSECSFQLRAQNSGRPEHYSEDRVSE